MVQFLGFVISIIALWGCLVGIPLVADRVKFEILDYRFKYSKRYREKFFNETSR